MGIIDWIDSVNGVIIIFIIVALIIIGWYVYSRYVYSRKRSSKTTSETEKSIESEKTEEPEIVVFLRPHPSNVQYLVLCIENIGIGAAYNVQFVPRSSSAAAASPASTSNLNDIKLIKKNDILRKGFRCFGAGQKIEQFLFCLTDELPEKLKHPIHISVTYTDSLNHSYENKFSLDFGDFESLVLMDSKSKKITSEQETSPNIIQARQRQPTQHKSSVALHPEDAEHHQPIQDEQDQPLPPELQTFVDLYNAGNNAELRQNYSPHFSISVSNEPERLQNPNAVPIFQTKKNGSLVAYAIDTKGDLYAVAPFFGCILQDKLYGTGAFGEIFECQGFHQGHRYHIKVIYPAFFKYEHANGKWTPHAKGKLELEEKEN